MKSIRVCEYSRSLSIHFDLMLQGQASGERSQDQLPSGSNMLAYFSFHKSPSDRLICQTKSILFGLRECGGPVRSSQVS